jgi:hypothetical protein
MKENFFLASLLFVYGGMQAQELTLSGTADFYGMKETGKIYYTASGSKFNKDQFISYDKNKTFIFTTTVEKLQKEKTGKIVFTADTSSSSVSPNACTHTVNVKEIISSDQFKGKKEIKLKTDLPLEFSCEATVYYGADMDGKGWLSGRYQLITGDTIRVVTLSSDLYNARTNLSITTKELMNEEFGGWGYNPETKQLVLYLSYQMNNKYGLIIRTNRQFVFTVTESTGGPKFEAPGLLMKKQ